MGMSHRGVVAPGPLRGAALRVMSLNVAHGRRLAPTQVFVRAHRFRENLTRVAAVLRREAPHVIALQEADGPSFWSGEFHHVEHLAELTGYAHHFWGEHHARTIGRRRVSIGTALLSKLPLANPESFTFKRWPLRGRKGFVVATLPFPATPTRAVDVVSVHLDFLLKKLRRTQIREMARELADRQNPLIILGDMNCWWERRNDAVRLLTDILGVRTCQPEADHLATFPSLRPRLRPDWIFVAAGLEFGRYQVVADRVSDHLGVVAEIHAVPAA
jgi:endonuclease/exonuclease/phosphatase family metal-dependent hydrolase